MQSGGGKDNHRSCTCGSLGPAFRSTAACSRSRDTCSPRQSEVETTCEWVGHHSGCMRCNADAGSTLPPRSGGIYCPQASGSFSTHDNRTSRRPGSDAGSAVVTANSFANCCHDAECFLANGTGRSTQFAQPMHTDLSITARTQYGYCNGCANWSASSQSSSSGPSVDYGPHRWSRLERYFFFVVFCTCYADSVEPARSYAAHAEHAEHAAHAAHAARSYATHAKHSAGWWPRFPNSPDGRDSYTYASGSWWHVGPDAGYAHDGIVSNSWRGDPYSGGPSRTHERAADQSVPDAVYEQSSAAAKGGQWRACADTVALNRSSSPGNPHRGDRCMALGLSMLSTRPPAPGATAQGHHPVFSVSKCGPSSRGYGDASAYDPTGGGGVYRAAPCTHCPVPDASSSCEELDTPLGAPTPPAALGDDTPIFHPWLSRRQRTLSEATELIDDDGTPYRVWNGRHKLYKHPTSGCAPEIAMDNKVWVGDVAKIRQFCSRWMQPLVIAVPWHKLLQCSAVALRSLVFRPCSFPASLELHMDGSGADPATWCFVVLWTDAGGHTYYGGSKCGFVITDPSDPEYIGASSAESNSAELSAFTWALLNCLKCCQAPWDRSHAISSMTLNSRLLSPLVSGIVWHPCVFRHSGVPLTACCRRAVDTSRVWTHGKSLQ